MKRFALLKLKHNANLVLTEFTAPNSLSAIKHFQTIFKTTDGQTLDDNGYLKIGEVTFTIAEFFR